MMRALVLDDSRAVRKILRNYLEALGFQVVEAEDGQAGLERFTDSVGDFDLALVDWNMPVMGGLDFVKAVRALEFGHEVHLMMVTTETEIEKVVAALEAGANEYLTKPFTQEMVAEKVKPLSGMTV